MRVNQDDLLALLEIIKKDILLGNYKHMNGLRHIRFQVNRLNNRLADCENQIREIPVDFGVKELEDIFRVYWYDGETSDYMVIKNEYGDIVACCVEDIEKEEDDRHYYTNPFLSIEDLNHDLFLDLEEWTTIKHIVFFSPMEYQEMLKKESRG